MSTIRLWEPSAILYYSAFRYCRGGLYNLNIRELQTTETELRCIQSE
jgi:hypothetical protein